MEVSPENHVRMQAVLQCHVDNSISKTINMSAESTVEDVANAYLLGWKLGLKGMTIYREGTRDAVLSVGGSKAVKENPVEARGYVMPAPEVSHESQTRKLSTGCGNIYLTMNKDDDGNIIQTFVDRGSRGTCMSNQIAVSRLISLALRGGIDINDVIDQLQSIPVCPSYYGRKCSSADVSKGSSCPSAIAFALKRYAETKGKDSGRVEEPVIELVRNSHDIADSNGCPNCGEPISHEGGCLSCYACGWSKCS